MFTASYCSPVTDVNMKIRVGMSVGHHPEHEAYTPDMKKDNPNPTQEEMKDAERRIGGGKDDGAAVKPSIAQ